MRNTLTRGNVLETSVSAQSVIKFKRSPDHITLYADFSYRSAANYQFGRNSVEYFADGQVISMDFRNQYFDNMPDRGYGLTGKVAYTYQFLSGVSHQDGIVGNMPEARLGHYGGRHHLGRLA